MKMTTVLTAVCYTAEQEVRPAVEQRVGGSSEKKNGEEREKFNRKYLSA